MEWLWYFFFYSAAGLVLETLFALVAQGKLQSRKTLLFLPLCPVYGLGAVGILLLPAALRQSPLLLLLAAGAVSTAAEYVSALFYEYVQKVRFWDYSALPFQLQGRVCLPFSLLWGVLVFPMEYGVQPLAERLWTVLPVAVTAGLTAAFFADLICTTLVLEHERNPAALRWWVRDGAAYPAPFQSAGEGFPFSGQRQLPDSMSSAG